MKIFSWMTRCIWVFAVIACNSNHEPEHPLENETHYAGMVKVASAGDIVVLGSTASDAPLTSQPSMTVQFSNSIFLSQFETSTKEFYDVMGYYPIETYDDSLGIPVRNVNWFEAVLYCNKKSRLLGLDTVYTYFSAVFDAYGRVNSMKGLSLRWGVTGVRLPTEAEWTIASEGLPENSLSDYSWYSENSDGIVHPSGERKAWKGLFDIKGNVMEWVQDGFSMYRSGDSVLDFAGNWEVGSTTLERVVKGGSYQHSAFYTNKLSRSDYYPIASADRRSYLGFRTAIGAITPSFSDFSGRDTKPLDAVLANDPLTIRSMLQRFDFKVVFVDAVSGKMGLINSNGTLLSFPDTGKIAHPILSPDGNWIAYGTRLEGQSGDGEWFIRSATDLNLPRISGGHGGIPRWWVHPTLNTLGILYNEKTISNDDPEWKNAGTLFKAFHKNKLSDDVQIISSEGSFNGGISNDGFYLASGYRQLLVKDTRSLKLDTLFLSPQNGKAKDESTQACNVSLSADSIPEIMFLDFGSAGKSTIIGKPYGVHEYLFIADISGTVKSHVPPPEGFVSWDDPEWSNTPPFAVAVARDKNEAAKGIWIINGSTGEAVQFVSGTELSMPYLWVDSYKSPVGIDVGKAGMYGYPQVDFPLKVFHLRLTQFWQRRNANFFFIGNSMAADGFDPLMFEMPGYNMAVHAADLYTQREMFQNYIIRHGNREFLRWIGVGLSLDNLVWGVDHPTWNGGVKNSIGRIYDSTNHYWNDSLPEGWTEYMSHFPNGINESSHLEPYGGTFRFPSVGWGELNHAVWPAELDSNSSCIRDALQIWSDMADSAIAHQYHIVFVVFPESPDFYKEDFFGPSRMPDELAQTIINRVQSWTKRSPYIHLYDANLFGAHDYEWWEAYDLQHLSESGARKLSLRLRDSLMIWGVETR